MNLRGQGTEPSEIGDRSQADPSSNSTRGDKTHSDRSCGRRGEQRPSLVDFFWPAEDAAAAVRSRFERTNWQARVVDYRPVEVAADGSDLVVVFRFVGYAELFAVRFSLSRMPEGPQTGEMCESLDAWAEEVDWVLDEELNTCMAQTAERAMGDDGVVILQWRNPSGIR